MRNFRESQRHIKSQLFKEKDSNINLNYESLICPSCAGQNLERRGFETSIDGKRKQKYRCQSCDISFVESSKNRPACPDCSSSNWVKKQDIDRSSNTQRFFCKKCSRSFILNSRPPCPDCGSMWVRKQGIDKSTQEQKYQCNNCARHYSESTKNKPREIYPPCPDCKQNKVIKAGHRIRANKEHRKQIYFCKICNRQFSEETKEIPKDSPKIFTLDSDYWDLREMGASFAPSSTWFTANYKEIEFEWLKTASKKYIKHLVNTGKAGGTCLGKLGKITKFSEFLRLNYPDINSSGIDRDVIVNFFGHLKNIFPKPKSVDTRRATIKELDEFIKLSHRFEWLEITNPNLIYPEDLPRLSKSGKTFDQLIPYEVLEQLVDNLDGLPIIFARMAFLMLGAPIRVSEVCGMRFDCIKQDKDGDWWLNFWDYKLNKEHNPIPIRTEIAEAIKLQQKFIREKLGKDYQYLFCAKKGGVRRDSTYNYTNKPPSASTFREALKNLGINRNITYQGEVYLQLTKTHSFRHTGASDLINKGMPLVMVQEILGHESPEMTLVYAKLYDNTLKEVWKEVAPKIVDLTGKVTEIARKKLDTPKYQKMKNIALQQQVNNGTCGLSVHQKCPKFHACYTCSKFVVTEDNLPGLKSDRDQLKAEVKQLKEQLNIYKEDNKLRLAEGCRNRIKQSREIVKNLDKMIDALGVSQLS